MNIAKAPKALRIGVNMSSIITKLRIEALRSLAAASIGVSYAKIGTRLKNPGRIVIIQNFTDVDLMFSADGQVNHLPLAAKTSIPIDCTANKTTDMGFASTAGTQYHVKQMGVPPTTGSVYITIIYGSRS